MLVHTVVEELPLKILQHTQVGDIRFYRDQTPFESHLFRCGHPCIAANHL